MGEPSKAKKSDLGPRLVTAAIGIPAIFALAFVAPNWACWLFYAAAAAVATQEWVSMCVGRAPVLVAAACAGTFAVLSAAYWAAPSLVFVASACAVVVATLVAVWGDSVDRAQDRITGAISGMAYASTLFGSLMYLTCVDVPSRFETAPDQAGWMLFPMAVIWAGDTGAYFAGRAFGKHKLAPRLSPKKTWEGAVGGLLASVVGGLLAAHFLLPTVSLAAAVALAAPGAVLGQAGDLSESALKRATGVKDSGTILYGHGGVLDRVDALMFAGPWFVVCAMLLGV